MKTFQNCPLTISTIILIPVSECSVIRCTYDNSCLHQVGFITCGGPQYGTTGIFLKAEVLAKKWWELKYRNVILSEDVEPLSDERRTELAKYHDKEVYFFVTCPNGLKSHLLLSVMEKFGTVNSSI